MKHRFALGLATFLPGLLSALVTLPQDRPESINYDEARIPLYTLPDPRGEFLAATAASPIYRLLGTDAINADEMPPLDTSVQSTIGYHIRRGKHDVTELDWKFYLDFADKHLGKR